jgi:hypothetical protein
MKGFRQNMFKKGIFIIIGTIALSNVVLFFLSIFYSTNLFNELFQKIISIEGLS